MSRNFLRVAKVGGSLLDFRELPMSLRNWLDCQPGSNVLIAGGGAMVDVIRRADEIFQLGEVASHRLSLNTMRITADLLAELLPEAMLVHCVNDLRERLEAGTPQNFVLDVGPWATQLENRDKLPSQWNVTSDSIAARVATALAAHELVLFKSTPLPPNLTRQQILEAGLVDGYFHEAAAEWDAVRWVNLRGSPVTERSF